MKATPNHDVSDEMIKRAEKIGLGKDLPGMDGLDSFEVFNSFWGNGKPTKAERNAMGILHKPLSFTRALMNGLEPSGHDGIQQKTLSMILKAKEILSQYDTALTVRQIYYRFVASGMENSLRSYKRLCNALAIGREQRFIPFDKITDRTRKAEKPSSWNDPKDFLETVKTAYRRNLNKNQEKYVEIWVEKDALAGVFLPITEKYDVHLVVGRGYPSHSALYDGSKRIKAADKPTNIFYFGDFDPSGEDIYRDVQARMNNLFSVDATFNKVSLTREDIDEYNLPPAPAKRSDSRFNGFYAKNGDMAVELDALPPDVLQKKIENAIVSELDLAEFRKEKDQENQDIEAIQKVIEEIHI